MNSPQLQRGVFLALLAVVTVAFLWVLMPFFGAVLWGVALAILFTPLYKWLLRKMRGKPNAAALSNTFQAYAQYGSPQQNAQLQNALQFQQRAQQMQQQEAQEQARRAEAEAERQRRGG